MRNNDPEQRAIFLMVLVTIALAVQFLSTIN